MSWSSFAARGVFALALAGFSVVASVIALNFRGFESSVGQATLAVCWFSGGALVLALGYIAVQVFKVRIARSRDSEAEASLWRPASQSPTA